MPRALFARSGRTGTLGERVATTAITHVTAVTQRAAASRHSPGAHGGHARPRGGHERPVQGGRGDRPSLPCGPCDPGAPITREALVGPQCMVNPCRNAAGACNAQHVCVVGPKAEKEPCVARATGRTLNSARDCR